MTTRAERIEMAIRHSGKAKGVVASESGVSPGALSQWLSGETKSMKPENLAAFCNSTGVRMEWIATGNGAMLKQAADLRVLSGSELAGSMVGSYPVYKEVLLSTGKRSFEDSGERAALPAGTIERVNVEPGAVRLASLNSDAMHPLIQPGALTAYDSSRKEIRGGKLYALDEGGVFLIRKIEASPTGYRLSAENKAYEVMDVSLDEFASRFRVLGWIFWWESFSHW